MLCSIGIWCLLAKISLNKAFRKRKKNKRKKVVHGFGIVLLTHRLGSRYISKGLAQLHLLPRDTEKDKELVERRVCVKNKTVDSRKKSNKPITH